ncbi:hypothetical protein [Polaribacter ponticola]|uniref:Uncharacterized protein n=1 Tax=Polaribacter ponticola TaxID=2978475 RepID=A0ABT5S4B2_9FLAO|nr:hypothetical protein [Polaribacter sp. MSW5]MDD7912951.1 hypothetical protein [Polaribacter sp. MSW5]MDD7913751.1 hypothetical protein [Polaribacter sp. MSW5]
MITTEQFYVNYEFSDEKVNDIGELTEDRVIELLNAFYEFKIKEENVLVIKKFECEKQGSMRVPPCIDQCNYCKMANDY